MPCKICNAQTDDNAAYCADCEAKLAERQRFLDNYGAESDGPPAREHHLFMLIYLVAIIAFTSIRIISILSSTPVEDWSPWQEWSTYVILVLSIVLIVFSVAILKWKWWGIFGFIATVVALFIVDMVSRPSVAAIQWERVWWLALDTDAVKGQLVIIYVAMIELFIASILLEKPHRWQHVESLGAYEDAPKTTAPAATDAADADTIIRYCPSCNIRYNRDITTCPECSKKIKTFSSKTEFELWKRNRRPQPSSYSPARSSPERTGNILVIGWAILIIVANLVGFFIVPTSYYSLPQNTDFLMYSFSMLNIFHRIAVIISAAALLYWKKWGFYGILLITGAELVFSLATGIIALWGLITGLIGIGVLYLIGEVNSVWDQMD